MPLLKLMTGTKLKIKPSTTGDVLMPAIRRGPAGPTGDPGPTGETGPGGSLGGLTATNDNIIQAASSAWASRTPAQVAATLTTLQTAHANLTALAGLSLIADRLAYANGTGTLALTTLTSFARTILDDADAAATRATLGAMAKTLGGAETVATGLATTGTVTLDCSTASIFPIGALTGNITLAASNVPASGVGCTILVDITQHASAVKTVTMMGGVTWGKGGAPTQIVNKWCLITLFTRDGGANWKATATVQD